MSNLKKIEYLGNKALSNFEKFPFQEIQDFVFEKKDSKNIKKVFNYKFKQLFEEIEVPVYKFTHDNSNYYFAWKNTLTIVKLFNDKKPKNYSRLKKLFKSNLLYKNLEEHLNLVEDTYIYNNHYENNKIKTFYLTNLYTNYNKEYFYGFSYFIEIEGTYLLTFGNIKNNNDYTSFFDVHYEPKQKINFNIDYIKNNVITTRRTMKDKIIVISFSNNNKIVIKYEGFPKYYPKSIVIEKGKHFGLYNEHMESFFDDNNIKKPIHFFNQKKDQNLIDLFNLLFQE